jgi:hypothetical protein
MSSLPQHPNLEHLKKQAKALLPDLRQREPAALLADAQHAIAREHGFASWPQLKAHVEAQNAPSPFRGEWIANIEKSRRHPSNGFHAGRIHFAVDGDILVVTHSFVHEDGREHHDDQVVRADGISHNTNNGYALTTTWQGPRVLEVVSTRHGEEVGRGRYEVSADGDTLTITNKEQHIVLDRKKG